MAAIDLTLGCIAIGVFLNIWFYGFSVVQTYIYYATFKQDRFFMKAMVAFLFVADSLNSFLDVAFLYDYLITHFGDAVYASRANVTFATDPVMTGIMAFSCQTFFAWRVYRLTSSWVLPMIIIILGGASFLASIGTVIGVEIVKNFAEFQKFQAVVIVWLACAAAADFTITASLIYKLQTSKTGFAATDDIITKLIRVTLQTGLLTSTFAIIDLILFLASTSTLHLVFNLPLAKLYYNSLLSTLNARAFLSGSHYTMETGSDARDVGASSAMGGRSRMSRPGRHASLLNAVSQRSQTNSKDLESGIKIHTVEERYEESNHGHGGSGNVHMMRTLTLDRDHPDQSSDFHSAAGDGEREKQSRDSL